ncbi:uncharacterized protein N7496_005741 [Penicillium cataractarum]|uniref:Uncharacterized protein n=1 Tax=Penicillium cataractarum TaxID=2100454 RepID=A0A9W9SHM3_9EURO|nr:uncharacterized protein N7496_005741 [Penicillium cataractarum]KAJ5378332.1 hypothetical protein N7496_005741 [Penicillium cataractarum]
MVDSIEIQEATKENALSNPELCATYHATKAKRQVSRRPAERSKIYSKFGRIHFDLIQLDEASNRDKWLSHLYLEGIRFHITHTHKNKNGCVKAIREALALCRNQFAFVDYIAQEGIIWERSVAGTPEQNGFIERAGGVIILVARATPKPYESPYIRLRRIASNIWQIWFLTIGVVREERDIVFDETIRHNG